MVNKAQNKSIDFFDSQFQQQIRKHDYSLNSFESRALDYLSGSVLDLGCGLGNLSLAAGQRGYQVTAVDASLAAVLHINAEAEQHGLSVTAIQGNLESWDIDQQYDTIVAIGLLMFFRRERALELLCSIQEHVTPGGRAIINVLTEETTFVEMFDPDNYFLFPRNELEEFFTTCGWKILSQCHESFSAPKETRKEFSTVVAEKPKETP